MYSNIRFKDMKLIAGILTLTAIIMLSLSFTFQNGGPKHKKVYKDTIYRFKSKPLVVQKDHQSEQKPLAVKPAPEAPKPKPVVVPAIAEEDRVISITSSIKKFVVKKSLQKMYVYFADTFKVFKISLGFNPIGHKSKQGDGKTPEGTYKITLKNPHSRGYKSLKISYPNESDRANARSQGVDPGGDIFIHGLWWGNQDPKNHWKDNWTRGCIAVNNEQIEEIFNHCNVETDITIAP